MSPARIALLRHFSRTPPGWEDVAGDHRDRIAEHAEIAAATREWLRERGLTQVPRERIVPIIPKEILGRRWNGSKTKEEVA